MRLSGSGKWMLKAFLPVTLSKVDSGVHVVTAVQLEHGECYWISIGYLHGLPRINMRNCVHDGTGTC